jgi:hypothetical protein
MPYSVESLCNVKKDSRAHAFVFKSFSNDVNDTMHLVYCRVTFSETKLMRWHCLSAMMGLRSLFLLQKICYTTFSILARYPGNPELSLVRYSGNPELSLARYPGNPELSLARYPGNPELSLARHPGNE